MFFGSREKQERHHESSHQELKTKLALGYNSYASLQDHWVELWHWKPIWKEQQVYAIGNLPLPKLSEFSELVAG